MAEKNNNITYFAEANFRNEKIKKRVDIKKSRYFIAVIGNGINNSSATLYFLKNLNGEFKLFEKASCFVGINGWAKRSDEINDDLMSLDNYKKEGDGRTPEGLFILGRMFSHDISKKTKEGKEPGNNPNLYCYNDLNEVYECCVPGSPVGDKRNESEQMTNSLYKRAIFINYNYPQKNSIAGSCIFLHINNKATDGCVAVNFDIVDEIFQLISPNSTPILMISKKDELNNFPKANFLTKFI